MERGISNKFINKVLYRTAHHYVGCWSCDNIPFNDIRNLKYLSLVVNTANVGEKGVHFVSILISPKSIRLFDSQAFFALSPNVMRNLKSFFPGRKIIKCLMTPIQGEKSVFCGFYTIYSVLRFEKHIQKCLQGCTTSLRLNQPFNNKRKEVSLMRNDNICINQIIKLIKLLTDE